MGNKSGVDALLLKVARNLTALMQLLQLLVGRGCIFWCGGSISPIKLGAFVAKMAARYLITRSVNGRAFDRRKGLATVHFIAFPLPDGNVAWWLLSDDGIGGLNDLRAPDAHVTQNAMSSGGHIVFGDYVLHYRHKKDLRTLKDKRTGKAKKILVDISTWTWSMTDRAFNEVRANIERTAAKHDYGDEGIGEAAPKGLRGILFFQRSRPLFSGVREQVLGLHRLARDHWARVRPLWLSRHPKYVARYGDNAGALRPLNEVIHKFLPKMARIRVYGDEPRRVKDLIDNNKNFIENKVLPAENR